MEFILVVEDFLHGVDLEELRTSTFANVAAQVGNLVIELYVAFLTEHTHGCHKEFSHPTSPSPRWHCRP